MNYTLEIFYFNQLRNPLRHFPLFPKCLLAELEFFELIFFFKVPHLQESAGLHTIGSVRDFRFEFEYEIKYENDVSILVLTLHMIKHPSQPMSYNTPLYLKSA